MASPILSLHHVTATVADAQEDLDFYVKLLGMRLVKKTVNFDNHNVFHFYYGNERGTPSTIMTTFPYKGWGVPTGRKGAGQITTTSFSVPRGALDFWRHRLEEVGIPLGEEERFGARALRFQDPSGLVIELIEGSDERAPWIGEGVSPDMAVRGLHSVTLRIRHPAHTVSFLKDVLGLEVIDDAEGRTRLAMGDDRPGQVLDIEAAPEAAPALNGLGTVHHVAFAVADADVQLRIRADLVRRGVGVTEVRDRQYFRSIYFREPGGVLYEIATVPPGFLIDEELEHLGEALKLPPWEEPFRETIQTHLPAVSLA